MIFSALFSVLSSFISTISYIFPSFDLQTPYNANITPILQDISSFMAPYTYYLAFDHLLLSIAPVFAFVSVRFIINNISTIKTLVKWW
jgi:hypothetical protein